MKKRNMIKKGLACVMAATMTIGLAACGGSNGGGDDVSEADFSDPESIKGTITVGGWPSGDDGFEAAMEGFHKVYPNIEVEMQFTDTTAHHQALQTALSAGDGAPDVAMVEGAYVAQYRESSALTNLLEEPYNAGELEKDFVEFKWDQCKSADGSAVRLIPWDVGPCTYFYRTDIFEECGLPTDPDEVAELMSTWDGVLEVARKVNIPGKRWLLPDASYLYFELFCNRDYYDEDLNLQLERDGDLDCLNAVIKMREEGLDMNVDMWGTEATAAYGDGSLVSVCTGGWFGGFLKTDYAPDASGKWGVAKMPGGVKNMKGEKQMIYKNITFKAAPFSYDLTFDDRITLVGGDSGTGKTVLYEMLEDIRLTDEYKTIKLFNYKSDDFLEAIKQCRNSFIVIDNADCLINDDVRRFINFELSNQYMLFLRNCDELNVSDKSFKELKFDNNRITLEEEL